MVLGSAIRFNSGGINSGAGLESGTNVDDISKMQAYAQQRMKKGALLPTKASAQKVMNAAKVRANMEANAELVKALASEKQGQVNAALQILQTGTSHAESMMKAEQRYQQIQAGLGKAQLHHRLATGVLQSESVGYQQAYARTSPLDAL